MSGAGRSHERNNQQAPSRLLDILCRILRCSRRDPHGARRQPHCHGRTPAKRWTWPTLGSRAHGAHRDRRRISAEAQGCQPFGGFFIEYDRFQLLCLPVAERRARRRGARARTTRSHPAQNPAPGRRPGQSAPGMTGRPEPSCEVQHNIGLPHCRIFGADDAAEARCQP